MDCTSPGQQILFSTFTRAIMLTFYNAVYLTCIWVTTSLKSQGQNPKEFKANGIYLVKAMTHNWCVSLGYSFLKIIKLLIAVHACFNSKMLTPMYVDREFVHELETKTRRDFMILIKMCSTIISPLNAANTLLRLWHDEC